MYSYNVGKDPDLFRVGLQFGATYHNNNSIPERFLITRRRILVKVKTESPSKESAIDNVVKSLTQIVV